MDFFAYFASLYNVMDFFAYFVSLYNVMDLYIYSRLFHSVFSVTGKVNMLSFVPIVLLLWVVCLSTASEIYVDRSNITELSQISVDGNPEEIVKLSVYFSQIEKLRASDFIRMKNVESIILNSNQIQDIFVETFWNLSRLKNLEINFNKLDVFREMTLTYNIELKSLDLYSNNIQVLGDDTFATLVELDYVDLGSNKLSYLQAALFRNNKKLKTAWFRFNRLEYIDSVQFQNMHSLNVISFTSNPCYDGYMVDIQRNRFSNVNDVLEAITANCSVNVSTTTWLDTKRQLVDAIAEQTKLDKQLTRQRDFNQKLVEERENLKRDKSMCGTRIEGAINKTLESGFEKRWIEEYESLKSTLAETIEELQGVISCETRIGAANERTANLTAQIKLLESNSEVIHFSRTDSSEEDIELCRKLAAERATELKYCTDKLLYLETDSEP